ncbi:MAG TPA: aldo/keto reductase [Anaerolineaceae bacterium]|nr:aldo/keto reductase [Anaerolineaceae bacterium]
METFKLNNGIEMPILGFGVYQIEDQDACEQAVLDAFEAGYRLIDTAALYVNEAAVGKAIRKSGIGREDMFVTTKCWIRDAGYEKTMAAFNISQEKLGLDVIDLFLIHQPFGDYYGSWRAMQDLVSHGKVRAIGVSNFYPDRLVDLIINSGFTPALNQVEINPWFQQFEAQAWNERYGVRLQAWAPLARGKHNLFQNPLLLDIANKHQKTVAQIVLRWLTQRGIAVIPKSVHKERIVENFNIFDFQLDQAEMEQIKTLDTMESSFGSHYNPEQVIKQSSKVF